MMRTHRLVATLVLMCALAGCGGGGNSKTDPQPASTCTQRLGTAGFINSTVNNPSVTDSTCPAGSTLTTAGISYTTTTTTYNCPDPNAAVNPVANVVTSAPIVTQAKVCTVTPTLTCSQKLGTGSFVDSTSISTVTDNVCPVGQVVVQNGLSEITTTTRYSCADPSSTSDPVASSTTSSPVLTQPKVCNLAAPINYSTYFRDKTGVTQANAAGFTGTGIKIAVYDNGFNVNNAALAGRVSATFGDLTDDSEDNTSHGTSVAAIAAGQAWGDYPGGVAPNATLALADWNSNIFSIINWGAKVFNFSFGYGYDEEDPSSSAPDANDATSSDITRYVAPWVDEMRAIRDSGGFLAISAGNDGEQAAYDSAGILAAAPAFYTDLNNIVAVVAMSPLNGTKAVYSNPCGAIAMNFCLAAPGTVNLLLPTVTTTDPLTTESYKWFAGTSAAAPIVSGIAALVYQAFPGFNGNQVRQTLLTTATDLGALGVDPIYGWGYVNAEKAVLGPAQLNTSFFAAVPNSVTWTFGNDIAGDGELIKAGGGALNITGHNTYKGPTVVSDGVLNLFGSLGSQVELNGGTFNAYGGTINGHFMANGGVLGLVAGAPLQINGELQLNGALLSYKAPTTYTSHWQGNLLSASMISGNAQWKNDSPWFTGSADMQQTTITASVWRVPVTQVLANATATQQSAAQNLESAFRQLDQGNGSQALRQSAALLQATDSQQAASAFTTLAGQSQTTLKDVVLETSDALQPILNERLRDIARTDGDTGGAWFVAANPDARKRAEGFLSTDVDSQILAAGIDRKWDGTSVGVALFTADDRIRFDGVTDRIQGDRQGLSIYARHQSETWYWQGLAAYNRFDSENTRTLQVGTVSSQASSRSSGSSQFLVIEAGRPLTGNFSLALQASADWASLDGFSESGDSGLELGFPSADYNRYLIGPDFRFEHAVTKGLTWDAQLGYRHVLNDIDTGMRAYYTGLPGTLFTVEGMPYTNGYFQWGIGLGYRTDKAYWYLRGNGQHTENNDRFTVSGGLRVGF